MFEQPGVRNIRERKAARDNARHILQLHGPDPEPPHKGSLEHLIWEARQKLTQEEKDERQRAFEARMRKHDLEAIERNRCRDCGADTINYSHSFTCRWRGSGF